MQPSDRARLLNFRATARFTGLNVAVAAQTFQRANRLSVEQSAEVVLEEAEAIVPVGETAELRNSGHTRIEVNGNRATGLVIFDAGHAGFVEFGTGLRGEGTYPYPLPTEGVPLTGSWVYDYKKQGWVGMESRSYLRPALDTSRPSIVEIFRDNIALATKLLGG